MGTCSDWTGYPAATGSFGAFWTHFQFYDHDTSDDDEIQLVTITAPEGITTPGGFGLVYTDLYGGVWETRNIAVVEKSGETTKASVDAAVIRAALTTLPNEVIPDCGVNVITQEETEVSFQVTFTSPHNSGDQHMLGCNINECSDGCSPYIKGIRGDAATPGTTAASTVHCHVQELWKGEDEAAECSNRGICDSKSGVCECFTGHTDEDCSEMTALI